MDRKILEGLLSYAKISPPEGHVTITNELLAALCRTQLAVWDSKIVRIVGHGTSWKGGGCTELTLEGVHQDFELLREHRIVPEGE